MVIDHHGPPQSYVSVMRRRKEEKEARGCYGASLLVAKDRDGPLSYDSLVSLRSYGWECSSFAIWKVSSTVCRDHPFHSISHF